MTVISLAECLAAALQEANMDTDALAAAERDLGQEVAIETVHGILSDYAPHDQHVVARVPEDALPIMGYEAKWVWDTPEAELDLLECPAEVPDAVAACVCETAIAAYRALGCRDWSRVDLRLDSHGIPHIIEAGTSSTRREKTEQRADQQTSNRLSTTRS